MDQLGGGMAMGMMFPSGSMQCPTCRHSFTKDKAIKLYLSIAAETNGELPGGRGVPTDTVTVADLMPQQLYNYPPGETQFLGGG